jgi:bifunctional ADP-heptose synthase (sugar kinase/adenylyltransferase)/phosphoglycolate phosphatase-like HAD superfamily hydrolase
MIPAIADLVGGTLKAASRAHVAVLGDFCMDHYLFVDPSRSEVSIETGLRTRPVSDLKIYPGGAGNVAANLTSLGVGKVVSIGVLGNEMYGRELRRVLEEHGIDTEHLYVQDQDFTTNVYTKVYEEGEEDPRLDLGNFNTLSREMEEKLLAALEEQIVEADVVVVNQQVLSGIYTDSFMEKLVPMMNRQESTTVIVDSRSYAERFSGTIRKINDEEARGYLAAIRGGHNGSSPEPGDQRETSSESPAQSRAPGSVATEGNDLVPATGEIHSVVRELTEVWQAPLVVTRGENGSIVAEEGRLLTIPGIQATYPIDTVGAGDTLLAGTAVGIAVGLELEQAVHIGNLAASITVKKLHRTGQATPEEMQEAAKNPPYRLNPALAGDPARANHAPGSRIELVEPIRQPKRFRYAMLDHDGTISVLREGWEPVMEAVMVESILGNRRGSVSEAELARVSSAVSSYIIDTTGIQSIEQMEGLVRLIRDFGYVPEGEILSAGSYKERYLGRLDALIGERLELVKRGVLSVEDVTVKGAVATLKKLKGLGMSLFLASGSDHEAVVNEATILGYADLFDGGIFGSVDDLENDPKSVVIRQILDTIGEERATELLAFGDGPVEIREAGRQGGVSVGIASDEVRRWGLNQKKRRRLILAGARYVMPDFTEIDKLLEMVMEESS